MCVVEITKELKKIDVYVLLRYKTVTNVNISIEKHVSLKLGSTQTLRTHHSDLGNK